MKRMLMILAAGVGLPLFSGELSSGWLLAVDPSNCGRTNGWAAAVRADAKPAPVPGVVQQVFPYRDGVAWYYRTLKRPSLRPTERLVLSFGAIDYFSEVFIDGMKIGEHEGAEDPFSFDVTERLKEGSLLAVRVLTPGEAPIDGFDRLTTPHRNKWPKMKFEPGWCYNTGGLTLPVTLDVVPSVRVLDAFVRADWKTGRVTVETTVSNALAAAVSVACTYRVKTDDAPHPVCAVPGGATCAPGLTTFETSFTVADFKLWSIDTPNVYTMDVEFSAKESESGVYSTRFGFRDFRLEKGWFTLNGKRLYLKSAHTGNHMPGGLAVVDPRTPELEFADFQIMKAMGYNCVRFIATQATPRQLDFCDRLGLMVYQETYASWVLNDSPQTKRRYLDSIRAELKRDRNHPSLTIWGALNETKNNNAFAAARDMLPEMRKLDPTRLWILGSGRWDKDWSVGSTSNPGSTAWEHQWMSNEGDLHFYPGYPHDAGAVAKLRTWGAGDKPCFISEYGVGSLLDVIDHCYEFERRGVPADQPDYALMRSIRDRFLADWKAWGLDRVYADPVDFLRDSDRMNARSRREGFDLVRSNPRFVGFNLTGALDHAICGEGPLSLFRRVKDANYDVFRDGWSDLRWCLFIGRGNSFVGEPLSFEAVLADFEALPDGEYVATLAVTDATGRRFWERKCPFSVPQKDADGLRAIVYPILKETVSVDLPEGAYRLRAYLDHGGYAAAYEKEFHVTARPPKTSLEGVLDVSKCSEEAGRAAMEKVAAGATALVRLDQWGSKPPKFLPLADLSVRRRAHWLYHDDTLVVPHPLTAGTRTGFYDWDWWTGCFPMHGFRTSTPAESIAMVNFNVGGPGEYAGGLALAVYRHGKGRLIVSTLPLDPASPAGARILSNLQTAVKR